MGHISGGVPPLRLGFGSMKLYD
ncbi:MAG: hypothetical protein RL441_160, partial [Actinomycetota bacterium]